MFSKLLFLILFLAMPKGNEISVSEKLNVKIMGSQDTAVLNFVFKIPKGEHLSAVPEPGVDLTESSPFVIEGNPEVKITDGEQLDPKFGVKVKLKLKNPGNKGKMKIEGKLTYFHCSSLAKSCMISYHSFSTGITVK